MSLGMRWTVLMAAIMLAFIVVVSAVALYARSTYDPSTDKDLIQYKVCVTQGAQWRMAQELGGSSWRWECVR